MFTIKHADLNFNILFHRIRNDSCEAVKAGMFVYQMQCKQRTFRFIAPRAVLLMSSEWELPFRIGLLAWLRLAVLFTRRLFCVNFSSGFSFYVMKQCIPCNAIKYSKSLWVWGVLYHVFWLHRSFGWKKHFINYKTSFNII